MKDDEEDGWASETSGENGAEASNAGKWLSTGKQRSSWVQAHHAHRGRPKNRRRPSMRRGHTGDRETSTEESGARDTHPSFSQSAAASVSFAGGTTHSRSRPGTAETYLSRTSAGGSLRNHRVESLRAMHSSVPPTRESSPSRSVRFSIDSGNVRKHSADEATRDSSASSPIGSPLASAQASRSPSPIPGQLKQV